ncbi:MAG: beta galactosidase jelly roll domain-containing protein, partial [Sedimentisphaerales bacterium]|nr:beta galactosidase jelly roll domain-containing protein [Sedimentisphaerales bacterium]
MQEKVGSVVFFVILSVVFFSAAEGLALGESQRERLLMDFGWEFNLGHLCDVEKDFGYQENRSKTSRPDGPCNPEFDASAWPKVDLPHDWAVGLAVDSGADAMHAYKPLGRKYPENSVGWYRKNFEIPESDLGKRLSLEFDGVFRNCEVWLNGYSLYRHLSGYTSFEIDITDYVNYGGRNVVVVRVDASGYELWSYEGAGIYRHVWLVKASAVHVVQWGTFVMSEVEGDSAVVTIETKVANESDEGTNIKLRSTVVDAEGQEVVKVESGRRMKGWSEVQIKRKVKVSDVHLWSLEEPYLYKLVTEVEKQGQVVDRCETTFGIRSFRFDADSGFFLNGQPIKLKGVCLH